ncbi:hypothetical protein SFR_1491 [Streptomyces sp. FR-008]|nr:hypothetical protein SFR_1491 [Streptomyces sp. FR-008]
MGLVLHSRALLVFVPGPCGAGTGAGSVPVAGRSSIEALGAPLARCFREPLPRTGGGAERVPSSRPGRARTFPGTRVLRAR